MPNANETPLELEIYQRLLSATPTQLEVMATQIEIDGRMEQAAEWCAMVRELAERKRKEGNNAKHND